MKSIKISNNVIRRMPRYLRKLDELSAAGVERISSNELGRQLGLTPSQIRQDFSCFGEFGQQGYGYHLASLREEIAAILGMDRNYKAIVMGVGNIGRALLDHFSFEACGFQLLAAFDPDKRVIGSQTLKGIPIYDAAIVNEFCAEHDVDVAVLCVPSQYAQIAADAAVNAGVKAIWNFTNAVIELPEGSPIVKEDLYFSDSLLTLEYYLAERIDEETRRAARMDK
ncbi:MAG: redox-sensing transcriptional repressor Rex [Oscillospiraceae bacterium]|nr:redox-sensing transcriptional repressor Rex [Oscillospiraceae bacterium]